MTTFDTPAEQASAAASGASATERFHADKSAFAAVKDTPTERVDQLAREVLDAIHDHHPQAQGQLRRVQRAQGVADPGRPGRRVAAVPRRVGRACGRGRGHRAPAGQQGHHRGPVLRAGLSRTRRRGDRCPCATARRAPRWYGRAPSPRRTALRWPARSNCGTPTPTASTRSSRRASRSGTCAVRSRPAPTASSRSRTIRPAPYQIPTDGACGKLISAAGWHAWRPAHLHVKVTAPGHELLTAQLYFPGDPHNEDDIAAAVPRDFNRHR